MSDSFQKSFQQTLHKLRHRVQTDSGDWTVKGFIDIYQRIYTASLDTKVLSKVLELLMFPVIQEFAIENGYHMVLAGAQNHYPDISLISDSDPDQCYALDVKTTYRTGQDKAGNARVNGMTLGTFGGYFRIRDRAANSTFAYNRYLKHFVLGVVYSRIPGIDERRVYTLDQLEQIPAVARDFAFFIHEKYQIASDQPGSGNTKNIGASRFLSRLLEGKGVFSELGIDVFNDYWMNYRTRAMAITDSYERPPYTNLLSYKAHKQHGAAVLQFPEALIQTEAGLDDTSIEESED